MAEALTVDIVYHFLPRYREGVLSELLESDDLDVRLISGVSRPTQEHVPFADDLPYVEVRNRWAGMVLWQAGLRKLLRQRRADVVIFLGSWNFASTWAMAKLVKAQGASVLFWTHGWQNPETGARGFLRRSFYRLADGLLLYGDRAREIGISQGFDPDRLFVIGNSLAVDPPPADRPMSAGEGPATVLWVARLLENKRLDLLVDAFDRACDEGHDLRLVVVGDGPAPRPVSKPAHRERIEYLGAIHDDGVLRELFDRASVVAIPSSAGLTVLHALLHGVPVVVNDAPETNGPEYEFVRDGWNGSTFAANDAAALTQQIVRWCVTDPVTPDKRAEIAEAGRRASSPSESAARIRDAVVQLAR